jgi:integrase
MMLPKNLAAAGTADRDESGYVVDFHPVQHTYISRLAASGANIKVAQELARPSTPTLTFGRYAHVQLVDQTRALAALPAIEAPRANVAALASSAPTPAECSA